MEEQARDEELREDRRDDTDHQRHGEAAHWTDTDVEQHQADQEGRDVGVENGRHRAFKASAYCLEQFLALVELFANALVDEHVGVDGHTEGQHDAAQTRQGDGRLHEQHARVEQEHVQ